MSPTKQARGDNVKEPNSIGDRTEKEKYKCGEDELLKFKPSIRVGNKSGSN